MDRFRNTVAPSAADDLASPGKIPNSEKAALALLLLVEFWVFSGAFHKFFNLDSLFYMTYVPQTWQQFWQYLMAPDDTSQYRPLNLGFIALLHPFLGVDPHPYHWVPIIFHLANTLLFYFLSRRLLASSAAILAATAFWGLHSVAGWITYDTTYLSDFLLAFLLLLSLLLAVTGYQRKSKLLITASLFAFVFSLLTKEAATTFPLAIWISLGLSDLRRSQEPVTLKKACQSFRKTFPLTCLYLMIAVAFAGLFIHWYRAGMLYPPSAHYAYNINPWSNPLAKTKYLFWALNLPDALSIPNPGRNRALASGLMFCLLLIWSLDILRRRVRLSAIEWAGIAWFAGLSLPALLLSSRLAKWYLYIPLLGLALAFGVLVENLRALTIVKHPRLGGLVIPGLLAIPILFSSLVQTRSYLVASDAAYVSDVLQACLSDFQAAHPTLPRQVTLFFLPTFDEGISDLLSVAPNDRGQLFELYYPGTRVHALFAHKGARLPDDFGNRSDVIVLQYLDRRLYDVTAFLKSTRRMTLFLLPTSEREVAPLLKKEPAGGRKLYQEFVQVLFADEGARLPDDYPARRDFWILQYMEGRFDDVSRYFNSPGKQTMIILPKIDGKLPRLRLLEENPVTAARLAQSKVRLLSADELTRLPDDYFAQPDLWVVQYLWGRFNDVTDYYKGRRKDAGQRVIRGLEGVRYSVNRAEFYPDYENFGTPTGAPAFFPTPEKEILTQIGGSTVVVPLQTIPSASRMRFDVSWMFDGGDGGWAEAALFCQGKVQVIYREYMQPDPNRKSLAWKEVSVDLQSFAHQKADLILRCYNDQGKNTVADWLNWRDIVIEGLAAARPAATANRIVK